MKRAIPVHLLLQVRLYHINKAPGNGALADIADAAEIPAAK